ncbi:peptide ABC transporter substrate-binding protein [Bacillus massiliigorillae]|uniref:peptide ABC transporter substrate-binding protein n=1 Tax=Bacillus massiliigorillae TaxID=1243664 RepID=UPI0005A9DEF7|nr:peptide ABC transporter substrate-binding protein [Bacillus massiliigorillae]
MKKTRWSVISIFLVLLLVMTGCSTTTGSDKPKEKEKEGQVAKGPKVLNLNNSTEPGSLHPAIAQGTHDSWVLEHIFEGLTRKNPEGEIVPGVAEKWDISPDGKTYTFTIKDGMKWSNGDPLTAHDFEYAWKYALSPEAAGTYAYQFYYIVGAKEYNEKKGTADQVGIKALDDKTLEVKLTAPTAFFLDLTTFYTYYPINQKVQEANPKWANEASSFVSNGAFKLTEWKHKESIKIEKNENYHEADKIKLDVVNFAMLDDANTVWQMYQNNEVDLVYPLPTDVQGQLLKSGDKEFQNGPQLAVYYYNFNNKKKPFNNVKVRKALAMAIDRKVITENVVQGGQPPAYGIIPPGIPDVEGDFQDNSGNLFKEDIDEAKKLLQEGLKEEGMDKMPSFSILFNTDEGHKKVAEAVQEMWRKNLGVDVTLESVEFQVKLDREKAGDFTVSRAGWVGDYVDPMTFSDLWLTGGAYNDAKWSNLEYDKLINSAKVNNDNKQRSEQLHKAEQIMIEEMPVMPIYFYTRPFVVKEKVTGVYLPINRFPQFMYADIK